MLELITTVVTSFAPSSSVNVAPSTISAIKVGEDGVEMSIIVILSSKLEATIA